MSVLIQTRGEVGGGVAAHLQCPHCGHFSRSHAQQLSHIAASHPCSLDGVAVGRLGNILMYQSDAQLFHCAECFFTCRDFTKLYKHIVTKHCTDGKDEGEDGSDKGEEEEEEEEEGGKAMLKRKSSSGPEEGGQGKETEMKREEEEGGEDALEKSGDAEEERKGREEGKEEKRSGEGKEAPVRKRSEEEGGDDSQRKKSEEDDLQKKKSEEEVKEEEGEDSLMRISEAEGPVPVSEDVKPGDGERSEQDGGKRPEQGGERPEQGGERPEQGGGGGERPEPVGERPEQDGGGGERPEQDGGGGERPEQDGGGERPEQGGASSEQPEQGAYRCLLCGWKTKLKGLAINHAVRRHVSKTYAEQIILRDSAHGVEKQQVTAEEEGLSSEQLKQEREALAKVLRVTNGRFVCLFCGWKSKLKGFTVSHVMRCHDVERPYSCRACRSSFFLPSRLQQHVKATHRPGRYACPFCYFRSPYLQGFRRHCSRCNAREEGEGGEAAAGGGGGGAVGFRAEGENEEEAEKPEGRAARKRRKTVKMMEGEEEDDDDDEDIY